MITFPKSWQFDQVKRLCQKVVDCVNKTAPTVDHETPYKMIRTSNVKNGRIDLTDAKCVDEATFIKWNRRLTPRLRDIVLTREAPLGDVGLIRDDQKVFLGQRTMLFRANPDKLDQCFLYYSLLGPTVQAQIKTFGSGSTVEHMRVPDAEKLTIPYPDTKTQRKIAAILTAYDDLIETNKRRIALLEKMAEELYREWFVRMRFPGYKQTKFVKGVPVGWEICELKDRATINPSSLGGDNRPDVIHYIDIGSVTTNCIGDVLTMPLSLAPGRAKRRVQHGDIIWASVRPANRAYCLIFQPIENLIVSTGFAVIRPKADTPYSFLNFAVTSNGFVDQMTAVAKGAAYPATSFDDFEKAKLLWPSKNVLADFHKCCEPLFHQKYNLVEQNRILTRTRDLLLPRLISGKLSVEDLEIEFPPSMREAG